jgi:PKD domain
MKHLFTLMTLCFAQLLLAQSPEPERLLDFNAEARGDVFEFTPIMPPLMQKAGAPAAYWTYFWEFGDGSFSREENPSHIYALPGNYTASLDATAHYDDGKRAKRKKKGLDSTKLPGGGSATADVFDPNTRQMLAMEANAQPKAMEEITLVISYRNLGMLQTDGRLHLFFNEKKFPDRHFEFVEARTHFREYPDNSTSEVLPMDNSGLLCFTALPVRSSGLANTSLSGDFPPSIIIQEMLNAARGAYRAENAWRFNNLQPGESRNIFVSLACTPNMLRDTNAFIHLEAVFAPFDPVIAPEKFVYEIEIVSSHDPNAIAVSDNRVNYRILGSKKLDYKIQFQNNGEGPASTVEVKVDVPKGLKLGDMRPVAWYPKCPICPKIPDTRSCLDTASVDGALIFTFRNIYLPGSRQKDVDDRDSTKGFVKYRIEPARDMPKLPFKSRAKIVFDKNPPIYTNYTKTGFKVGKSPGLKAGYGFQPNLNNATTGEDESSAFVQNGYFLLGASLSPYKSWRIYPQIELLAGIRNREDLPATEKHVLQTTIPNNGIALLDSFLVDTITQARRGFVSFELPVLLRKNFNRFFGAGLGASARIILENGETKTEALRTQIDWSFIDGPTGFILDRKVSQSPVQTSTEKFRATRYRFSVFGDLTFGSVRAGPNLGLRGGLVFGGAEAQAFVQLTVEMKL